MEDPRGRTTGIVYYASARSTRVIHLMRVETGYQIPVWRVEVDVVDIVDIANTAKISTVGMLCVAYVVLGSK